MAKDHGRVHRFEETGLLHTDKETNSVPIMPAHEAARVRQAEHESAVEARRVAREQKRPIDLGNGKKISPEEARRLLEMGDF